ncbi:TPA: hypothetical protein DD449_03225 [Candidatus Berkelbacteria bacterium]|uniref:Uncharacterized protein n=1 Tax=Berkelbacteria bacterium GW2011_GWE1_39_12 TaxID=1618337 RepID=A0A0G4B3D2_9BACT|nr:MAG: hypothetical protein UT28_C0001G0274 [Berkelbacteria bacterium GW2011_GWE1_39_12]HBO60670.1 hypothetical protein [Candidatus Berkelbacteria bacterium]
MERIRGFVGVAKAQMMVGFAQIIFGRATVGEENIYEPLAINGITPFETAESAKSMLLHLSQRKDVAITEAYLAELDMQIAEKQEELHDVTFTRSDQPMILLRRHGTDTDFIGVYKKDAPGFTNIVGSNLLFNGLQAFDCFRDLLEISQYATSATGDFFPIATFNLTKIPG